MIVKIILIACWIIYALLDGYRDAHFYSNRMTSTNPDKQNIHWVYFLQRLLFGGMIAFAHSFMFSKLNTFIFSAGLIMMFSFFHNGKYYLTRNKLDPNIYKDGWWSSSKSSEATLELSDMVRTCLAVVGLGGILISIFDKTL